MLGLEYFILFGLIMLSVIILLIYGLIKLFSRASKRQRILLAVIVILCTGFSISWWIPIGTLTGTWQLHSDFRAHPRHIGPAPLEIQFFDDGSGIKIDHDGYEQNFEWHITVFDELAISTRIGSYIVRFTGFGTRLTIENVLRGEATMGRFDTRSDFRASFRRRKA